MNMEIRILGEQPEPTMTMKGMYLTDIEYRTRDFDTHVKGKEIVVAFINAIEDTYIKECLADSYGTLDDPLSIYIGYRTNDYDLDDLALSLEAIGMYGKGGGYNYKDTDKPKCHGCGVFVFPEDDNCCDRCLESQHMEE
jgi:hypothetical protein|tara:strand:- start:45 stop:461 length:417 start_codon:yes stop_codon:yes gene_type:complete